MKVMSHDLGRKLIRKLGIPGDVKKLDIQFEAGKPVTIEVEVEVTDRMGRVIDSVFEGYTIKKKDKEPEKEVVNLLDEYEVERRKETVGFSASDYLKQPHGSDLDFEDGTSMQVYGRLHRAPHTPISVGSITMIPCSLNSGHTHHVQGSEYSECRKTRQFRLNNPI